MNIVQKLDSNLTIKCKFCNLLANYIIGKDYCCSDNFSKCTSIKEKIKKSSTGRIIVQPKTICLNCNKEISNSNIKKHIISCKKWSEYYKNKRILKDEYKKDNYYICPVCNKSFLKGKSFVSHYVNLHTKTNLKLKKSQQNRIRDNKNICWCKGKTKNTNSKVLQISCKLKEGYQSGRIKCWCEGKHLSEDHRKKLSDKRRQYLLENPDKHPNKIMAKNGVWLSYPEKLVFDFLIEKSYKFEHNYFIKPYWCDFYLFDYKSVIEVDGFYWHSSLKQKEHDKIRDEFISSQNIKVYRIPAKNVLENLKKVLEEILELK